MNFQLKILPLGGLGKIGANMCLFQSPNTNILIDVGIMFPENGLLGIDYMIPDLDVLKDINIDALWITHGHEDHIGAIPYFLKEFPEIEVFCTPFVEELIVNKFKNQSIKTKINIYISGETLLINDLEITPIHVNHSIPQTHGIFIRKENGNSGVFYVSDFKVDLNCHFEKGLDFKLLEEKSKNLDMTLAMVDSTNILVKGKTLSENDVLPGIKELFFSHHKNIFVTLFPSNIYRMKTILEAANENNFQIVLCGRAMETYFNVANKLSFFNADNYRIRKKDQNLVEKTVYIVSGCQGDERSALKRISSGKDPYVKIKKEDIFIYSAKTIPGNENAVIGIFNDIAKIGTKIITTDDLCVHASGHPGQEDLKIFYQSFKPTHAIPIHGESLFLRKHIEFLKKYFPKIITAYVNNRYTIEISNNCELEIHNNEEPYYWSIHGKLLKLDYNEIKQRKNLGKNGLIVVQFSITDLSNIYYQTMGLHKSVLQQKEKLNNIIINVIKRYKDSSASTDRLSDKIKIEIKNFLFHLLGQNPVIIVLLTN